MANPNLLQPEQGSPALQGMRKMYGEVRDLIIDKLPVADLGSLFMDPTTRAQATDILRKTPFDLQSSLLEMVYEPVQLQEIAEGLFTPNDPGHADRIQRSAHGMSAIDFSVNAAHDLREFSRLLKDEFFTKHGNLHTVTGTGEGLIVSNDERGRRYKTWRLDITNGFVIRMIDTLLYEKPDVNQREFGQLLSAFIVPYFNSISVRASNA